MWCGRGCVKNRLRESPSPTFIKSRLRNSLFDLAVPTNSTAARLEVTILLNQINQINVFFRQHCPYRDSRYFHLGVQN